MEVLIFIVVLIVLIVVHELGHFIVAKLSHMRVDEFGLGYPPRLLTIATIGETKYTLNALPFGGFVKIYGEDGNEDGSRAFPTKPKILQAATLVAGIFMNLVLAYVFIAGALFVGTPQALTDAQLPVAKNIQLAVAGVLPNSPAAAAKLEEGDIITAAKDQNGSWQSGNAEDFSTFVGASDGAPITLTVQPATGGKDETLTVTPSRGIDPDDTGRYVIGVDVALIGVVPLSLGQSITQGASLMWNVTKLTGSALAQFFGGIFTLHANLSQVAGPVGIASVVGNAASQGFGDLLSIVALISINLALINLIPIPALDGGRLLFVIIEAITRKRINPKVAQTVNMVGFAFLILLMVVVTAHDIYKIAV